MNEISKVAAKSLVKDESLTRTTGKAVAVIGAGGIGLVLLAGLLPFVGVFGLSVVMVLVGLGLLVFG